jgi:caspase domain-containing protein
MTPWVDRAVADGPSTHALVIGTSYYRFLPQTDVEASPIDRETFGLRQTKTPATSAWRFANWLKDSYNNPEAPLGTVRLLASPSEYEKQNVQGLANLPEQVLPATRDNVEEAVDGWHQVANTDPDNVAILYASGHGIQLSKDEGGIVLLEDFARRANAPLDHALDVGSVRRGMAGPTMAQKQFYFVDACEVRPREAIDYLSMGDGVGLANPYEGAARCSAVFYSASPSTEALGEAGKGTLFVQALMDCLELGAVDDHVHENGSWVVTTGTLMRALPESVSELAQRFNQQQTPTTGGQLADVIFHVLPGQPVVPVILELEPADAAQSALARLWDGISADESVFEDQRFTPTLTHPVPAGHYVLTVSMDPPSQQFRELAALPIPALPPAFYRKVPVG